MVSMVHEAYAGAMSLQRPMLATVVHGAQGTSIYIEAGGSVKERPQGDDRNEAMRCIKLVEAERPGDGRQCYLFLATAVRPRIRHVTNGTTCDLRTDGVYGT